MRAILSVGLSPYDVATIGLSSVHLLFSLSSGAYILHFQQKHHHHHHLLRLNSLWPVRLLLLLFGSLLSLSHLLLPLHRHCNLYFLSSQSFSQPAFFSTLLFLLLRASNPSSSSSSSSTFLSALSLALAASLPFLLLHSLYLFLPASLLPSLLRPPRLPARCPQPLFATMLLAVLAALCVPLFLSACWSAVTLVINRRLRLRLYTLVAAVVIALSVQVTALALSELWSPAGAVAQALGLAAFVAVLGCAAVGEMILVVMPVVDALAIVKPERSSGCGGGKDRGGELRV